MLTGAPSNQHLPLEICSFAEYVILIDALWPQNRLFKPPLVFAFLPAAFMALMFPTVTIFPPIIFYTLHQFVMHGCIVAYILARYAAGEYQPRYRDVWLSLLMIVVLVVPMYFLDRAVQINFMFLTYHSENPALRLIWDLTGGNGGLAYVFGLAAIFTAVFHVMYGIFTLVERLRHPKSETTR